MRQLFATTDFKPSPRFDRLFSRIFGALPHYGVGMAKRELFVIYTEFPVHCGMLDYMMKQEWQLQIADLSDLAAFTLDDNFDVVDEVYNQLDLFGIVAFEPTRTGKKVACVAERFSGTYRFDLAPYNCYINSKSYRFLASRLR